MRPPALPRYCHASSSRIIAVTAPALPTRHFSALPSRTPESVPFFGSPFKSPIGLTPHGYPVSYGVGKNKGKGKALGPTPNDEEVDDREWEMRSARAMLHLRNTLPRFFDADQSTSTLFPADIFSPHMSLKLHHPIPLKVSSLSGYTLAFALARNGMQALHSDLQTSLERITYTQSPHEALRSTHPHVVSRTSIPTHRQKQIRVAVAVYATIRLPPHTVSRAQFRSGIGLRDDLDAPIFNSANLKEAVWKTSSLYTICPRTGLILSHEVESIRPLPGEGVAEWLKTRLLGWTSHAKQHEGLHDGEVPCPRTVPLPAENELSQRLNKSRDVGCAVEQSRGTGRSG